MFEIALLGSLCFVCYLALCGVVVLRTGSAAGLRDVAIAVRGLRGLTAQ
ncbi:hypothetical protein [Nocardia pseudobrasiliensis]|uniref:Uncharacterized protein n=1 Tax=Nocardia pseudobrasiliensis TaxID=45979 RepID=A0A370I0I0_9NOCA|nr:hypothetical protein [Nocardia pseudobrasiliensis]RDI63691.1 hypothetical protein DFR76_10926 [Nocardia pseudobrasiliensis]